MHIPDGYLSPSTCACLYGGCAPFWYRCLKRVRHSRQAQAIPLLSLFAAFSFVLMMFNLPLPGGTTGHAVGVGIAAVVLGPSLSVIAISMALLIQALFFGDGGITAFGANCFNMAIVGSFAAAGVYRVIAWRAGPASQRRVWAAGFAGYLAVNAAAFCASLEFGIQPLLFHDAHGAPLYAPYPLWVAVPAMMIGHLTVAGFAEFIVTAGLVRYLQRSHMDLLTTPQNLKQTQPFRAVAGGPVGLWAVLATLILITPLGIVAVGTAWGEWKAGDFKDQATRKEIAAASGNRSLPAGIPQGFRKLSGFWKAPLADYSPGVIASRSVGYTASAFAGVILLLLSIRLLASVIGKRKRRSLAERTGRALFSLIENTLFAEQCWQASGFLQRSDARVKVAGACILILAAACCTTLSGLTFLFLLITAAAALSRIPVFPALARVWLGVVLFTGFIALPALVIVPGKPLAHLPLGFTVTEAGLHSAAFLILRAQVISTICATLVLTTVPGSLLRSLRSLRVPAVVVANAGITYRYVFLFARNAASLFEARDSRTVGRASRSEQRRTATLSAGALLDKVFAMSHEVYGAMSARGFRGEFYLLDEPALRAAHWLQLAGICLLAASVFWL